MATEGERIGKEWLRAFEARVNARDFQGGRELFEEGVVGYGSRLTQAQGLDPLVKGQWMRVWPNIEGFGFRLEELWVLGEAGSGTLTLAVPWTSTGIGSDGAKFERPGRCTHVIHKGADGAWRCVHSHYSLQAGVNHDLRKTPG